MEDYEYHEDNWDWNYINGDSYDDEEEREYDYKMGIVCNPNTPQDILITLSKDKIDDVRSEIARNPNTPQDILITLSKDKESAVRWCVAENPNTPIETLIELSKDKEVTVRKQVAEIPNTPNDILIALSKDEDYRVREGVASNPNTPNDILIALSKDQDEDVRRCVAENPTTPKEAFIILSKDENEDVRWCVAKNNKIREYALKNMEKLSDPSHQSTQNEQAELVRKLIEDKMANNRKTLDSLLKEKGYDRDSGIGKELVKIYNDTQDKLKIELEELKSQVVDIAISDFNDR